MLGGYQILDLRSIGLEIGSEAVAITNPFILKQLLAFRDYIDKAYDFKKPLVNQLKPVLIRFRDQKANEKTEGATFGELSVDGNYYTFKITARISGALVLTINVAFEEVTNAYGNKEWVIDSATQLLKDESKTITGDLTLSGDLSVGDDASIGGDLSVVGDITGSDIDMSGKIEGAEIIEKMSGYAYAQDSVVGLTNEEVYCGVCKNGNKITFALATNLTRTDTLSGSKDIAHFTLPNAVAERIFPTTIGSYSNLLLFNKFNAIDEDNNIIPINVVIAKSGLAIYVTLQYSTLGDLPLNKKAYLRIELTLLLSENLSSE